MTKSESSFSRYMHWAQTYPVIVTDVGVVVSPSTYDMETATCYEKKFSIVAIFGVGLLQVPQFSV